MVLRMQLIHFKRSVFRNQSETLQGAEMSWAECAAACLAGIPAWSDLNPTSRWWRWFNHQMCTKQGRRGYQKKDQNMMKNDRTTNYSYVYQKERRFGGRRSQTHDSGTVIKHIFLLLFDLQRGSEDPKINCGYGSENTRNKWNISPPKQKNSRVSSLLDVFATDWGETWACQKIGNTSQSVNMPYHAVKNSSFKNEGDLYIADLWWPQLMAYNISSPVAWSTLTFQCWRKVPASFSTGALRVSQCS